ncbi:MAG: ABC transporter ATP-binding protein/permease [Cephaloticoccus sp.]|nr:ABC transporter ATP-binding protein/permease [Cephaloticoccus sp.]
MVNESAVKTRNITVLEKSRDEEDEAQFRPLQWGLIRRLFTYTTPVKGKTRWLIVIVLLRSIQLPAMIWASSRIISGPIADGKMDVLPWAVLGYAALAIVTEVMMRWRQRLALEIGEIVVNSLRAQIFAKVQRQPMSFFNRVKLGRIISRVTSDVESLRVGIQNVFFVSLVQGGQMVVTALVMAQLDLELFGVVLAMAPVLWMINRHFRVKLSTLTRSVQESFSRVTATLAESVSGIRVTQGFVRQETNAGFFRLLLADHSRYNLALARTSGVLSPLLELNSQFFVAILLLFGGWRTFHGDMAISSLIQFFFLSNFFFSPIATLGNQYNQALVAMAGAERVFRLLDTKPDWEDEPTALPLPDPRLGDHPPAASVGARVELRNLTFGYNPANPVLHEVSFIAEPGQTIALVGHTGSGKSSIINLVAKFYLPTRGELLIDGHEIRQVTSLSLHRQMGMVQQQNFLYSGTVMENIRLSKPEASEDEIRAAARRLDCLDILEALPQGLLTEVGERGSALSIGQRQLVCFTRAMLADPRIVILDEATSSIDALTEARLQKALLELLRGRTSFIVAHRLSTIRHADQVLLLDQGRIIERGRHEALLAQGGPYAELYHQFVQMEESAG